MRCVPSPSTFKMCPGAQAVVCRNRRRDRGCSVRREWKRTGTCSLRSRSLRSTRESCLRRRVWRLRRATSGWGTARPPAWGLRGLAINRSGGAEGDGLDAIGAHGLEHVERWRWCFAGGPFVDLRPKRTSAFAARWKTVSHPANALANDERSSRSPSIRRKDAFFKADSRKRRWPVEKLSMPVTRCPRPRSLSTRLLPIKPAQPVTIICSHFIIIHPQQR